MTKAYFTVKVDLPDGATHEDFRFWAEHELRCAVGGTDADDPLRKLKRDKIIVRGVATPQHRIVLPDRKLRESVRRLRGREEPKQR